MYVFFMCLFKRMQILVAAASVVFVISSCSFKLTPKAKVSESSFDSRAAGNSNPVPSCQPEDLGCDGVCYSGETNDCAGICNGDTHVYCRGVCNGNTENDCNGDCGGNAVLDCNDNCNGTAVLDDCGVCNGTGASCADCNGTPNGGAVLDRCGVCDGDGSGCPITPLSWTESSMSNCGHRYSRANRSFYFLPPVTGQICCPVGVRQNPVGFIGPDGSTLNGISMSADECCVRASLDWTYDYNGGVNRGWASNSPLIVATSSNSNGATLDANKRCCATRPYRVTNPQEAFSSIKHVPIGGGNKGASLNEWNGNFAGTGLCLPGCSSATQNETLKGSGDPLFTNMAKACCRVSCTGDDTRDFAFAPLRGGSTCTPTTGVNGNDKGVCLPCPECEYKKQLPSVLTPCTHDQLLAERSQGKVPLCEKVPEVCTVPQ